MKNIVHLVTLPNHGTIEKESMNYHYYLYRIGLQYKIGDTILFFNCHDFAQFVKTEKHTWNLLETSLQEECELWLSAFSEVHHYFGGQEKTFQQPIPHNFPIVYS